MKNYRRSRSIKKSKRVDKICPKADYCKNADRCGGGVNDTYSA
jgi:hypothetical protein